MTNKREEHCSNDDHSGMFPVYMLVTRDKYRLPIAIADSIIALSELEACEYTYAHLYNMFWYVAHGKRLKSVAEIVWLPNDCK